jgi:hypothetical protein
LDEEMNSSSAEEDINYLAASVVELPSFANKGKVFKKLRRRNKNDGESKRSSYMKSAEAVADTAAIPTMSTKKKAAPSLLDASESPDKKENDSSPPPSTKELPPFAVRAHHYRNSKREGVADAGFSDFKMRRKPLNWHYSKVNNSVD